MRYTTVLDQHLDLSLNDIVHHLVSQAPNNNANTGSDPPRASHNHPAIPPNSIFIPQVSALRIVELPLFVESILPFREHVHYILSRFIAPSDLNHSVLLGIIDSTIRTTSHNYPRLPIRIDQDEVHKNDPVHHNNTTHNHSESAPGSTPNDINIAVPLTRPAPITHPIHVPPQNAVSIQLVSGRTSSTPTPINTTTLLNTPSPEHAHNPDSTTSLPNHFHRFKSKIYPATQPMHRIFDNSHIFDERWFNNFNRTLLNTLTNILILQHIQVISSQQQDTVRYTIPSLYSNNSSESNKPNALPDNPASQISQLQQQQQHQQHQPVISPSRVLITQYPTTPLKVLLEIIINVAIISWLYVEIIRSPHINPLYREYVEAYAFCNENVNNLLLKNLSFDRITLSTHQPSSFYTQIDHAVNETVLNRLVLDKTFRQEGVVVNNEGLNNDSDQTSPPATNIKAQPNLTPHSLSSQTTQSTPINIHPQLGSPQTAAKPQASQATVSFDTSPRPVLLPRSTIQYLHSIAKKFNYPPVLFPCTSATVHIAAHYVNLLAFPIIPINHVFSHHLFDIDVSTQMGDLVSLTRSRPSVGPTNTSPEIASENTNESITDKNIHTPAQPPDTSSPLSSSSSSSSSSLSTHHPNHVHQSLVFNPQQSSSLSLGIVFRTWHRHLIKTSNSLIFPSLPIPVISSFLAIPQRKLTQSILQYNIVEQYRRQREINQRNRHSSSAVTSKHRHKTQPSLPPQLRSFFPTQSPSLSPPHLSRHPPTSSSTNLSPTPIPTSLVYLASNNNLAKDTPFARLGSVVKSAFIGSSDHYHTLHHKLSLFFSNLQLSSSISCIISPHYNDRLEAYYDDRIELLRCEINKVGQGWRNPLKSSIVSKQRSDRKSLLHHYIINRGLLESSINDGDGNRPDGTRIDDLVIFCPRAQSSSSTSSDSDSSDNNDDASQQEGGKQKGADQQKQALEGAPIRITNTGLTANTFGDDQINGPNTNGGGQSLDHIGLSNDNNDHNFTNRNTRNPNENSERAGTNTDKTRNNNPKRSAIDQSTSSRRLRSNNSTPQDGLERLVVPHEVVVNYVNSKHFVDFPSDTNQPDPKSTRQKGTKQYSFLQSTRKRLDNVFLESQQSASQSALHLSNPQTIQLDVLRNLKGYIPTEIRVESDPMLNNMQPANRQTSNTFDIGPNALTPHPNPQIRVIVSLLPTSDPLISALHICFEPFASKTDSNHMSGDDNNHNEKNSSKNSNNQDHANEVNPSHPQVRLKCLCSDSDTTQSSNNSFNMYSGHHNHKLPHHTKTELNQDGVLVSSSSTPLAAPSSSRKKPNHRNHDSHYDDPSCPTINCVIPCVTVYQYQHNPNTFNIQYTVIHVLLTLSKTIFKHNQHFLSLFNPSLFFTQSPQPLNPFQSVTPSHTHRSLGLAPQQGHPPNSLSFAFSVHPPHIETIINKKTGLRTDRMMKAPLPPQNLLSLLTLHLFQYCHVVRLFLSFVSLCYSAPLLHLTASTRSFLDNSSIGRDEESWDCDEELSSTTNHSRYDENKKKTARFNSAATTTHHRIINNNNNNNRGSRSFPNVSPANSHFFLPFSLSASPGLLVLHLDQQQKEQQEQPQQLQEDPKSPFQDQSSPQLDCLLHNALFYTLLYPQLCLPTSLSHHHEVISLLSLHKNGDLNDFGDSHSGTRKLDHNEVGRNPANSSIFASIFPFLDTTNTSNTNDDRNTNDNLDNPPHHQKNSEDSTPHSSIPILTFKSQYPRKLNSQFFTTDPNALVNLAQRCSKDQSSLSSSSLQRHQLVEQEHKLFSHTDQPNWSGSGTAKL